MTRLRDLHTSLLDVATEIMKATERQPKGPKQSGRVVVTTAFPRDEINRDIVVTYTTGPNTAQRRMAVVWDHGTIKQTYSIHPAEFEDRSDVWGRAGPRACV